jgi:Protein of unknown function (DUF2934)
MASKGTSGKGIKKTSSTKKTSGPIPIDSPINSPITGNGSLPDTSTTVHPGIEEEIRQRAYELYEERGRNDGLHHEDWSRAETEILSRHQKKEKSA